MHRIKGADTLQTKCGRGTTDTFAPVMGESAKGSSAEGCRKRGARKWCGATRRGGFRTGEGRPRDKLSNAVVDLLNDDDISGGFLETMKHADGRPT